jgi:hypothetical protein
MKGWVREVSSLSVSFCENTQRHIPIQDLRHQQLIVTQGDRAARVAIILRRRLLALHEPLEVVSHHGRHGRDGRCVFGYHGLGRNATLELGDRVLLGSTDSIIKHTRRHLYKLFLFIHKHTLTRKLSHPHTRSLPIVLEVGRALASAESPKAKTLGYFLCCRVPLSTSTKPCFLVDLKKVWIRSD